MTITTKTNYYTISEELETMKKRFEFVCSVLFPDWEMEHFYYGSKVIMTTISGKKIGEYAQFNITANRVSFNGHTTSLENYKKCESMTHNDECHKGRLLELVNF